MDAFVTAARFEPPSYRFKAAAAIAVTHIVLLWAAWQTGLIQRVAAQSLPLTVRLVSDAAAVPAPTPVTPRPPAATPPPMPSLPAPVLEPAAAVAEASPAAAAPVVVVATAPAPPEPGAPATPRPAPVPLPTPTRIEASALRYRVEPPVAVPRLSRRLRESGTVLLHVVVDTQGVPREVSLRRSSGFARLDEQALGAMRQARFVPCTADGRPVECESDAPIVYELEN